MDLHRRRPSSDQQQAAMLLKGEPIYETQTFPVLPCPKTLIVSRTTISIDGLLFIPFPLSELILVWLTDSCTRWIKDDPSPENKEQIIAFVEAVETQFMNFSQDVRDFARNAIICEVIIPYLTSLLHGVGEVTSFDVDRENRSVEIQIKSIERQSSFTIHVPKFSMVRKIKGTETLSLNWPCPGLGHHAGNDCCRFRIENWVCSEDGGHEGRSITQGLPGQIDIPIPMDLKATKCNFAPASDFNQ